MNRIVSFIIALCYIILVLVAVSLVDILLVFIFPRFYSIALFIISFAVAGIFAGVLAYMSAIDYANTKDEWFRWSLIILIASTGLLFFFFLSRLEGGEYGPAFKAYGITMTLSMLLFVSGKTE